MEWQLLAQQVLVSLRDRLKTTHGWVLGLGAIVTLFYLPVWVGSLLGITLAGSANLIINLAFLYFGLSVFWQQRGQLAQVQVQEDDRWIGYALVTGAGVMFPLVRSSVSMQALVVMVIWLGGMMSSWGLPVLRRNGLALGLMLVSLYPDLNYLADKIWRFMTPPDLLENWMAWLGSVGLQGIGYRAVAEEALVRLPQGAVLVGAGCSGFAMALTLALSGWALGLFMGLNRRTIELLSAIGVGLALVLNVPRIMLLAIASIYWGKASFEFWHGPIGGQIFAGILFTIYYYVAMWLIDRSQGKVSRS